MKISYRKATQEDNGIIKEFLYHAIYIPAGNKHPDKNIIELLELKKYYADWPKTGDIGYIAFDQKKAIGAAWVRLLIGESKGYGYIDEYTPELTIAVLQDYRNKGIGGTLMKLLISESAKRYKNICLSVTKLNPATRLYDRMGFKKISEKETDIIMRKEL